MSSIQSDDMIKGRVVAMRSMIAQFQNEISQLEDSLIHRKQPTPSVPEGYIRHEGGTCPVDPETVESVFWKDQDTHVVCLFRGVPSDNAWQWNERYKHVIAYKLKPAVPEPSIDEVIERIAYLWACKGEDEKVLIDLLTKFHVSCKDERG